MSHFSTLSEWLDWQMTLHPAEIELGLARVTAVLSKLALPDHQPVVLMVGGTNGKGSTVALLQRIYLLAGYTVGSYTSPHLLRYNERITLNGQYATDTQIVQAFEAIELARGGIPLTFFEYGTLAAWYCCLQARVDVAVLEIGLGGRLDAVNVFTPDVAIVTSIGIDHTAWLGETREAIAAEKAAIFRQGKPAICADPAPPASIFSSAAGNTVDQIGVQFKFSRYPRYWDWQNARTVLPHLPNPQLPGDEQFYNASAVLQAIDRLQERLPVTGLAIREGLLQTVLPGRFQHLRRGADIYLDVAHNPQATLALANKLKALPKSGKRVAMLGVMRDKAIADMLLPVLPYFDVWYCVQPDIERALEQPALIRILQQQGASAVPCPASIAKALPEILIDVGAGDRLVIFGSFYTVAESLRVLDVPIQ